MDSCVSTEVSTTSPHNVSTDVIGQILTKFYTLENLNYSSVKKLDSWSDLNYYFQCSNDGDQKQQYVLKIIKQNDASNSPQIISSIAQVMKFLHSANYNCSRPIDTIHNNSTIILSESDLLHGFYDDTNRGSSGECKTTDRTTDASSIVYTGMVLTFVKGKIGAEIITAASSSHDRHHMLLHAIGRYFGSMDRTLMAFKSTVLMERQYYKYDLKHLAYLYTNYYIPMLTSAAITTSSDKLEILAKIINMYKIHVIPVIPTLSQGIIHNDGNMRNIIISSNDNDELFVEGVIDFGDCVHSCHIFELAMLTVDVFSIPYAVTSIKSLVHGYIDAFNTLPVQDLKLLYYVILGRLAQLYINGLIVCCTNPQQDNTYISQELLPNSWSLMQYLLNTSKLEFDSTLNI